VGPAVNLDHAGSPEVRRFLVESVLRWFRDFHVDALRLDAVHELKDDSQPHYLAELSDAVASCRPCSDARSTSSPRATSTTPRW
jgi:maltooligosyltrehalose trehalohydrolase